MNATRAAYPRVDIVIVNWNAGVQMERCIQSIAASERDGFTLGRVVVVDNASTDGSADDLIHAELPLTVIRNPENRGFAAACNQGAAGSDAEYLLFLNPDARVFPDSISLALAAMERPEHARTGILGIQLVDDAGRVSRSCARFPTVGRFAAYSLGLDRRLPQRFPSHFMVDWDHGESREVDHVIGAFFLVRHSLFETLHGFDEGFFVYLEDLDFSFRARRAGFRSFYLAEARAYHKGGGTSEQAKAARLFYSIRSRIQYGYKHFAWWPATMLAAVALFAEPAIRLANGAARRSGSQVLETLKGYGLLWRSLPELVRSRREA